MNPLVIPSFYKTALSIGTSGATILLSLPNELLLAIAEELLEEYRPSFFHKLKIQSWAGSRIILLGDYIRVLPEGLLTDAEREEFGFDGYADHELGSVLYQYVGVYSVRGTM
ncbi:hypothetical protein F5876DRAFT_65366 [Lentinula aff. lateritia]|uniref:Uncharacterized protein n=1 Tax=Lentinula aff. lateritia TaxID=2804960 RepID=A0ACC1U1N8_9AGAR|nr:hypothetical protein F5876DRAFT_65366 [Lentinula aff. lateritia]